MKNETHTTAGDAAAASHPGSADDAARAHALAEAASKQLPPDHRPPQERLIHFLEITLESMGFELVTIELINQREKVLRVFVDKVGGVGIEDCVTVTHGLDLPLEANKDVESIFKGPYELEVSSPGVDRPLRKPSDYTKFSASIGRIHTFRPLTAAETLAEVYSTKNPKQKNFYGIIRGFENGSVLLGSVPEDGTLKTQKGKKKVDTSLPLKNETLIRIPLGLISKANLEPVLLETGE